MPDPLFPLVTLVLPECMFSYDTLKSLESCFVLFISTNTWENLASSLSTILLPTFRDGIEIVLLCHTSLCFSHLISLHRMC